MGSFSSDEELDQLNERLEWDSYSLSADVSESESCSSFTHCHYYHKGAYSSFTSSPLLGPQFPDASISPPPPPLPIMLPVVDGKHVMIPAVKQEGSENDLSEVEMMTERFAKLLLGEDMSGGGKGVCTALAISNAIINLAASVFGELWKLEPLAPQKKSMWHREMEWLLCASNSIVELVPSTQDFPGGATFEVMVPRPRSDLHVNLPALKKLEAMLLDILDGFDNSEYYYVDRGTVVASSNETETLPLFSSPSRQSINQMQKWWVPFPKVPRNGLSELTRKRLQQCRDCANQIVKAALAINTNVLNEMDIPNAYLESLPKSGKACLGENIYRHIAAHHFSPDCVLEYLDLSSECSTLEMANKIEAAAHIWRKKYLRRQKVLARDGKKLSWGDKVKGFVTEVQRSKVLARRAETLSHSLRLRFPALPQTILDMSKIQYNKDVGHAIIESYSRAMEGLAFNIVARIEDLLYVDDATKQRARAESIFLSEQGRFEVAQKCMSTSLSPFKRSTSSSFAKPKFDSFQEKTRIPNRRTHRFAKQSKLQDSPIQTLQKLTF